MRAGTAVCGGGLVDAAIAGAVPADPVLVIGVHFAGWIAFDKRVSYINFVLVKSTMMDTEPKTENAEVEGI